MHILFRSTAFVSLFLSVFIKDLLKSAVNAATEVTNWNKKKRSFGKLEKAGCRFSHFCVYKQAVHLSFLLNIFQNTWTADISHTNFLMKFDVPSQVTEPAVQSYCSADVLQIQKTTTSLRNFRIKVEYFWVIFFKMRNTNNHLFFVPVLYSLWKIIVITKSPPSTSSPQPFMKIRSGERLIRRDSR